MIAVRKYCPSSNRGTPEHLNDGKTAMSEDAANSSGVGTGRAGGASGHPNNLAELRFHLC